MKILMVTMGLGIGGAETHILELTKDLVRCGHEVTVASNGGVFVPALLESGAAHVSVPLHSKRPDRMLAAHRVLDRLVRDGGFDVIHAHARIPGFVSSFSAKKYDVPFVTTFHGVFNPVWYLRMLTRIGERTLAVSEDVRAYLKQYYGAADENISLTVNGIDTDAFIASDEEAVLPEMQTGERILCVTRLDRESASHVFRMIEAMPAVVAARPDARLIVVGGGDVLDEVRAAAEAVDRTLGGGRIFVIGPRADVARIVPSADVFVGVSRAAMEAMAARVPVVLSGAQGHLGIYEPSLEEEAVSTNFCCRGRDTADAAALAACVTEVLGRSTSERAAMGDANREVVSRLYSVARMRADAEELYRRAIRDHVPRRGDVVISGYYGFRNAGDDALLASITAGLKDAGVRRISVLSKHGSRPADGVRAVSRFRFFSVIREIRRAKLLISGGGSLLQDATSSRSLHYYAAVMRLAKRCGVPVMVMANGIGPIRRPSNRKTALRALRCADSISVRERSSRDELIAMGIPAERIRLSADPVFRRIGETDTPPADSPYVVISLRERAQGAEDGEDPQAAEAAVCEALTRVCRAHSLRAVFLAMQPIYDRAVCSRAAARLRENGIDAIALDSLPYPLVRRACAGAEFVIAMRLHALIFAAAEGTPTAALSYDPKVDGLMDYLGMQEWTRPAYGTDAAEIESLCLALLERRGEIAAHLSSRSAELSALAEEDIRTAAAFLGKSGQ